MNIIIAITATTRPRRPYNRGLSFSHAGNNTEGALLSYSVSALRCGMRRFSLAGHVSWDAGQTEATSRSFSREFAQYCSFVRFGGGRLV